MECKNQSNHLPGYLYWVEIPIPGLAISTRQKAPESNISHHTNNPTLQREHKLTVNYCTVLLRTAVHQKHWSLFFLWTCLKTDHCHCEPLPWQQYSVTVVTRYQIMHNCQPSRQLVKPDCYFYHRSILLPSSMVYIDMTCDYVHNIGYS